jgi:predicted O-methyltransferase YrrM
MTDQERWSVIDHYFADKLVPEDPAMTAALEAGRRAGMPPHEVAPNQGKLLYLLARLMGAKRALELGTLAGVSTIWLARALPADGALVTLELSAAHAEVARANLARAGLLAKVDVRVGPALESLARLEAEGCAPFDLFFFDANKANNDAYLAWALAHARPGSLVVADNAVREGAIVDEASQDANVQGMRRFFDLIARTPRLEATALQTVGVKGHDGFALAVVTA